MNNPTPEKISSQESPENNLNLMENGSSSKIESTSSFHRYSKESDHHRMVDNLVKVLGKKKHCRETDAVIRNGETKREPVRKDFPKKIGRFEIESIVGSGSFGDVYRAYDSKLSRFVALKVPNISGNQVSKWTSNEANSIARLQHRSIVNVFEVGEAETGEPYIAMEFVENGTLQDLMSKRKLDPHEAAAIVSQVAHGIAHAHRNRIYHRDLKPQNILLTEQNEPKIADFGLAISTDQQRKMQKEWAGSIGYMSPEQIRHETDTLDGRSDVWSLGVIFYELLTGNVPFSGDEKKLTESILYHEACPPRQSENSIPKQLEDICLKCLEKNPKDRYSTAYDLARDLDRYQLSRSGRYYRKTIWSLVGFLTLSLIALIVVAQLPATTEQIPWEFGSETPVERVYSLDRRIPKETFISAEETNALHSHKKGQYLWVRSDGFTLLELGSTTCNDYDFSVDIWRGDWEGRAGIFIGRKIDGKFETCNTFQIFQYGEDPPGILCQRLGVNITDRESEDNRTTLNRNYRRAAIKTPLRETNHLVVQVRNKKVTAVLINGEPILSKKGLEDVTTNGGFGIIQANGDSVFRKPTFIRKRKLK